MDLTQVTMCSMITIWHGTYLPKATLMESGIQMKDVKSDTIEQLAVIHNIHNSNS